MSFALPLELYNSSTPLPLILNHKSTGILFTWTGLYGPLFFRTFYFSYLWNQIFSRLKSGTPGLKSSTPDWKVVRQDRKVDDAGIEKWVAEKIIPD